MSPTQKTTVKIKKKPKTKVTEPTPKKKETIDQLADDEFADMEIGELVGKIYNNISEVAQTRTKDGVGGSKIKPKQIRKKL